MKFNSKRFIQYIYITIGVILLDIGFFFFLEPAHIVIGGTMGLSIIFVPFINTSASWFTNSIFLYIIDSIALLCGLIFLGKNFFLKTIYATILSPTVIFIFEKACDPEFFFYNNPVEEPIGKFTALLCGVVLTGVGVGIALRNNGSTGGMDVFQKIMSKYLRIPISKTMYYTDCVIVLFVGFVAGSKFTYHYDLPQVLFGFIGVIIVGYLTDLICLSAKSRRTLYVITNLPDAVKELIYKELDRGVTFSQVTGAYTGIERTMVICTMEKKEAYRIIEEIEKIDPKAFMFVTSCKQVVGEYDRHGLI